MKRVIVTGATGFVGSNLTQRLVQEGHEVYVPIRAEYRSWRIQHLIPHLHLFQANLLDTDLLTSELKRIKPDWIFHLATYGAYSWQEDLDTAIQTNFLGTVNLIEASREIGFEVFINTGSSSEYGIKNHPTTENDVLEPNSYYAVTKASATLFSRYTAQRFQLPIFTLRLYSVYGPYEEPGRLIPTLILQGLDGRLPPLVDPATARDFIFTEDVMDAYLFVASSCHRLPPGEIYNIGTGQQVTVRELVNLTREVFHIPTEPVWGGMKNRSWDTSTWVANNQKLRAQGWQPSHDIRRGYLKTIEWFREKPSLIHKIYSSA